MKINKIFPVIIATTLIALSSCTENDITTFSFTGRGNYIKPIDTIISDSLKNFVKPYLHEGKNPPDIQGAYLASEYILAYSNYDSDSIGTVEDDMYFIFTDQEGQHCSYMSKQGLWSSSVQDVYIIGHDSSFSAYFKERRDYDHDATMSACYNVVISGVIVRTGIKNFRCSWEMSEKSAPDSILPYPVGTIKSFTDSDNIAIPYKWTEI
ncbi:MAG: hypothetical protein PHR20_05620 [Bacteroidales bacterium]|nr:hypothetical protein [Bacteroidales bacterium]